MFESSVELTPEQVQWLDKFTRGTWQLNPQTGEVDVEGDFNCNMREISDFKGVRFGKVVGGFYCGNNQLTSLEGSPREVGGSFYCWNSQLTTLEGSPQKVGGAFDCGNNQLTSLEGSPQKVGGAFVCRNNQLTTLEGSPQEVGGAFDCRNNQLTTLEGAPRKVGVGFYGEDNPVSEKTLESIFGIMEIGKGYLESVEYLWSEIPVEDQILLYRPEFEWVVDDEKRKLDALRAYQGFKGMI